LKPQMQMDQYYSSSSSRVSICMKFWFWLKKKRKGFWFFWTLIFSVASGEWLRDVIFPPTRMSSVKRRRTSNPACRKRKMKGRDPLIVDYSSFGWLEKWKERVSKELKSAENEWKMK
jgi:hypothetical protein